MGALRRRGSAERCCSIEVAAALGYDPEVGGGDPEHRRAGVLLLRVRLLGPPKICPDAHSTI